MKKVLILGGSRFVGRQLLQLLAHCDVEVTVGTRQNIPMPDYLNVKYVQIDRYDELSLQQLFAKQQFDVVYDMLAYASYDVEILLKQFKGTEKYIVISSSAVYENIPHKALSESAFDAECFLYESEMSDIKQYARGKRLVEATIVQRFPHIPYIIVRIPYVLGKDDYTERLLTYVKFIQEKRNILLNNKLSQFSFIDSQSAARSLLYLMNIERTHFTVNIADEGLISPMKIIEYISEKIGVEYHIVENQENNTPYNMKHGCVLNLTKAKALHIPIEHIDNWLYDLIDYYIEQKEH